MTEKNFFRKAHEWIDKDLPFVLYRKPAQVEDSACEVNAFFQTNDRLYVAEDFTESGFVTAPFDITKKSILIPSGQSEREKATVNFSEKLYLNPREISASTSAKQTHIDLVSKGIEAIRYQDLKKVVLSRKTMVPVNKNPLTLFQNLLQTYPTAFVYAWYHPKVGFWMGASPETLLKLNGPTLKTMALAGTLKVDKTKPPQWTAKEREEQQRVTDFIETTLSDQVTDLTTGPVENIRAGELWHLKCDISGRLKSKKALKTILGDLHPTPAVCGTPKKAAKQFILTHEPYDRSFYTGFIGELNLAQRSIRKANRHNIENQAYSPNRDQTHLFVNLRCMQLEKNAAHIYVGGGVVKDSDPEKEWEETVNKSRTMSHIL